MNNYLNKRNIILLIIAILSLVLIVFGITALVPKSKAPSTVTYDDPSPRSQVTATPRGDMVQDGTPDIVILDDYNAVSYEKAFDRRLNLFFINKDCVSCKVLEEEIKGSIPNNRVILTILKVDIASNPQLVEKYKITTPGVFMRVNYDLTEIKRSTELKSLKEIVEFNTFER